MINKQVLVSRVQTLADGSIRIVVDVLNGDADDFRNAFIMKNTETTMILTPPDRDWETRLTSTCLFIIIKYFIF
jgi:hypothetical protein